MLPEPLTKKDKFSSDGSEHTSYAHFAIIKNIVVKFFINKNSNCTFIDYTVIKKGEISNDWMQFRNVSKFNGITWTGFTRTVANVSNLRYKYIFCTLARVAFLLTFCSFVNILFRNFKYRKFSIYFDLNFRSSEVALSKISYSSSVLTSSSQTWARNVALR